MLICDYDCSTLYLLVDTWQPATLCTAANSGPGAIIRLDARAVPVSPPVLDARDYLTSASFSEYNRPGRVHAPAPGAYTYAFLPRSATALFVPPYLDIVRLAPSGSGLPAVSVLASRALSITKNILMVLSLAPEALALCIVADYAQLGLPRYFAEAWDVAGLVAAGNAGAAVSIGSVQLDGFSQGASFLTADASANGTAALAFGYSGSVTRIAVVRGQRFSSTVASVVIIGQFVLGDSGPVPRLLTSGLKLAFSSEGLRVVAASLVSGCGSSCAPVVITALLTTDATGSLLLSTQGVVASYPAAPNGTAAQPLLGSSVPGSQGSDDSAFIVTFVDGSLTVPQLDVYRLPAAAPLTGIRTSTVAPALPAMASPASITFPYSGSLSSPAAPDFAYIALDSGVLAKVALQPPLTVVASALLPLTRRLNDTDATASVQLVSIPGLVVAIAWCSPSTAIVQTYDDVDLTPVQQLSLAGVTWPPSKPSFDAFNNLVVWSDRLPSAAASSPGFCISFRTYRLTVFGSGALATLAQASTLSLVQREMCFASTAVDAAQVQRVPPALSLDGAGQLLALHAAANSTFSALGVLVVSGVNAGTLPATIPSGPGSGVPFVRGLVGWPTGLAFFVVGSSRSSSTALLVRRIDTLTWSSTLLTAASVLASSTTVFDGGIFFAGGPAGTGLLLSFDGGFTTVAVNQSADSSASLLLGSVTNAVSPFGINTVTALVPPGADDRSVSALVAPRFASPAYILQRNFSIVPVLLPSTSPSVNPSVTRSAAASPSVSSSVSPTATRSRSVSRSVSNSASASPSPSVTRSFGSSPSSTVTLTATSTYTPSAPATSPPSTVSPSLLPSATSSETASDTATASGTATSSPTPNEGFSSDATPSPTMAASASVTPATASATSSSSSTASLSASSLTAPSQSGSSAATASAAASATATQLLILTISPSPGGGGGNGSAAGAAGGGASDAPSTSPATVPDADQDQSSVAIVAAGGGGGGALLLLLLLAAAYALVWWQRSRAAKRRIAARIRKQGAHSLARASVTERALLLLHSHAGPGAAVSAAHARPGAVPAALLSPSGLEDMLMMTVPSALTGGDAAAAETGASGRTPAGAGRRRAVGGKAGGSVAGDGHGPLLPINSVCESPLSSSQLREGATRAALNALLGSESSASEAASSSVRASMTFGQPAVQDAHGVAAAALGARLPAQSLRVALDSSLQAVEASLREQRRASRRSGIGGTRPSTAIAASLDAAAAQVESTLSATLGAAAFEALVSEAGDACAAFCDVWDAAALEAEASLPENAAAPLDAQMDCIFAVAGDTSTGSERAQRSRGARAPSSAARSSRSKQAQGGQVASIWPKVAALRMSIEQRVASQESARTAVGFARSAAASAAVSRVHAAGRSAPASVRSVLFTGTGGAADDSNAEGVEVVAVEEGTDHHDGTERETPSTASASESSSSASTPVRSIAYAPHMPQMQRLLVRTKSGAVTSADIRIHSARRTADVSAAATVGVSATATAALPLSSGGSPEEQLRAARARGVMRAIAITAVTAQAMQVAQLLQDSASGEDEAAAALLGVTAGVTAGAVSVSSAGLQLGLPRSAVRSLMAATSPLPLPVSSASADTAGHPAPAQQKASLRATIEAARLGLALCSVSAGADAAAKQEFNALAGGSPFSCCGGSRGSQTALHGGPRTDRRPAGRRVKAVAAGGAAPSRGFAEDSAVPLPLTVNPLARNRSGGAATDGGAGGPSSALPAWAASLPVLRDRVSAVIAAVNAAPGTTGSQSHSAHDSLAAPPAERDGSDRRASFDLQSWAPAVPRSLVAAKLARQRLEGVAKVKAKAAAFVAVAAGSAGAGGSANRRRQSRASPSAAAAADKDAQAGFQLSPLRSGGSSNPAAAAATSAGKIRMAHAPVAVAFAGPSKAALGSSSIAPSASSSSSPSSPIQRNPGSASASASATASSDSAPLSLPPGACFSKSARTVVAMPSVATHCSAPTSELATARDYYHAPHHGHGSTLGPGRSGACAPRMSGVKVVSADTLGPEMARRTHAPLSASAASSTASIAL